MNRALIVLGITFLCVTAAHAASPKGEPAPVTLAKVERSVSGLQTVRRTAGFDAGFKEAVNLLTQLHDHGSASDKIDAQDLAVTALHCYMDHQKIELGSDEEGRQAKARKAAAEAGLLAVLGW